MIQKDKQRNALAAINAVLILARHLARESNNADIAQVLDIAEYLPLLILDSEDRTSEFRENLVELAKQRPGFMLAIERFDSKQPA